jgi:hypothetical protein
MKTINPSTALNVTPAMIEAEEIRFDDLVRRGLRGHKAAVYEAAFELRARIIFAVTPIMEGCRDEAEDIADQVILDLLEGKVRGRRDKGRGMDAILRHADYLARAHVQEMHWR